MDATHTLRLAQGLSIIALCVIAIAPGAALSRRLRLPVAAIAFLVNGAALILDIA